VVQDTDRLRLRHCLPVGDRFEPAVPRASKIGGGAPDSPIWVRTRCTGEAVVMEATMRVTFAMDRCAVATIPRRMAVQGRSETFTLAKKPEGLTRRAHRAGARRQVALRTPTPAGRWTRIIGTAMARLLVFFLWTACAACTTAVKELPPTQEEVPGVPVYVVSHGWHAGIVVRRRDIPASTWPSHRDFADAAYLEVGWGDKTFYQALNPNVGDAIAAAFMPTDSVLHIFGFRDSVPATFPSSEIIRIQVTAAGMQRLARYIEASHATDAVGNPIPLGPESPRISRFYLSRETYHLFNNCNVWAARALRTAGLPINPAQALTVGGLMSQARQIGEVIREGLGDALPRSLALESE